MVGVMSAAAVPASVGLWESLGYNAQTMGLGIGILLLGMMIGMVIRGRGK